MGVWKKGQKASPASVRCARALDTRQINLLVLSQRRCAIFLYENRLIQLQLGGWLVLGAGKS